MVLVKKFEIFLKVFVLSKVDQKKVYCNVFYFLFFLRLRYF